jgi:hypothetical protein
MAEQRSDDLLRSRQEAALLLRLDPSNLSPSDALRCDLIATLRLSIDSAQADALEGRAADLGRLIVATESLVKLLPSDPPKPEASQRADPRVTLWNIIKEGRDRLAAGEEGYDGLVRKAERLQAEVVALKAQLTASGLTPALPDANSSVRRTNLAIDPTEVVPPGELAHPHVGKLVGPDDPKPPVTIEGRANPPAASAPAKPAWQDWLDAGGYGGPGFDRWANRNF